MNNKYTPIPWEIPRVLEALYLEPGTKIGQILVMWACLYTMNFKYYGGWGVSDLFSKLEPE